MLTCKEISKLVSESLDRKLSLRQRMGVQLHLMMCSLCRTYRQQMRALRNIVRHSEEFPTEHLSDEARARIKVNLSVEDK